MPESPEQQRARGIRQGINVIAANAGTGKTHTLAELIAVLYEHEEARRFPNAEGHVTGDAQRSLLAQFMPVTFTRDSAAELNARILKFLAERGVPTPTDRWGKPYVVCRTLDSFIQRWFRRPIVFKAWLTVDPDFKQSIERALNTLHWTARDQLKPDSKRSIEQKFYLKWGWIPSDGLTDFILDTIIRESEELPRVPGVSLLAEWEKEWLAWLASSAVPADSTEGERRIVWHDAFWEAKMAPYKEYQKAYRELKDSYQSGALAAATNLKDIVEQITLWDRVQTTKREFSSVYELARARGYHPMRAKNKMVNLTVLRELAASDYLISFTEFHRLATQFYSAKVIFLLLDHGDFLNLFVEATEQNMSILERYEEYPRMGIRAKYTFFDEAQDNNSFQHRIIDLFSAIDKPYCAVACGDVKQAIYAFKGASSYGFANLIDRVRRNTPDNFFTLTCSFRSLPAIVELGNSIVQTLPHYKDTVFPSTTIYTEPGKVVVLPPIPTELEEADLVMRNVAEVLATTNDSIMIVHRNNLRDHPIYPQIAALNNPRLTFYTMHRSKGLQADHVFVLGLTSCLIPDVRGSYTQEVNLFYVACTRARKALYLSAPYTKKAVHKKTGEAYRKDVGPSVFISRLPILKHLADLAGWPTTLVARGEASAKEASYLHMERTQKNETDLRVWWRRNYPEIRMSAAEDEEPKNETGGAPVPPEIVSLKKQSIWSDGRVNSLTATRDNFSDPAAAALRSQVFSKLRDHYLRSGRVPMLKTREEFLLALKANWIFRGPTGKSEFTAVFARLAREPRSPSQAA